MEPGNPGCVQYVLVGEGGQLTPLGPLLQVTITLLHKGPLYHAHCANFPNLDDDDDPDPYHDLDPDLDDDRDAPPHKN